MASAELGKTIKQTQNLLGKYVKKPPLSEKNLSRPPFRFLHDVITSVITGTGFMNGVFDPEELASDNITSREAKTEFMRKLIAAIQEATGEEIPVKISKILSGQEPENTNALLQSLARAIQKTRNTPTTATAPSGKTVAPAPVKAKPVETKGATKQGASSDNKKPAARSEQSVSNKTGGGDGSSNSTKPGKTPAPVKAKTTASTNSENKNVARPAVAPGRKNSIPRDVEEVNPKLPTKKSSKLDIAKDDNLAVSMGPEEGVDKTPELAVAHDTKVDAEKELEELVPGGDRRVSAISAMQPEPDTENQIGSKTDLVANTSSNDVVDQEIKQLGPRNAKAADAGSNNRMISARPPSARPAPPRPRSSIFRDTEESNYRPPTGKVTNVLLDNSDLDEDDNFVIREASVGLGPGLIGVDETPELALATGTKIDVDKELEDMAPGERGLLVDQILETQKEIENRDGAKKDLAIDSSGMGKSRETSKAEIEKLKGLLQECARNANPLGKLLDYVREDIDSMQKEVGKWREESRALDSELEAAKRTAEASLQPIQQQLAEVEARVADKEDAIAATKMSVIRLQDRIEKILSGLDRVQSSHGKMSIPSASQLMKNELEVPKLRDENNPPYQRASSGFSSSLNRLAQSTPGMRPISLFADGDLDPDNFDPYQK